ncbi:hypothetical protein EX895_000102 [Sporisorium graminicola]|uniref:SHSP domain-containing protein n=1 Tax=Sporisorium graminicola TaxID=280036 RepID=A0A4U7KYZ8_9BASI|nr:hypothetical protein EX895_000102 [Sporisorium graminicola]TKY90104.1 hypothetical protein EX895_000102 [Sporisorium graminicola]
MEFFFPADVFAAHPRQGPTARTTAFGAGPSSNVFSGCGFDSHPSFADALFDAIQQERAAHARAQAQRAARAEAARRAKAAAARREAEERERQAQAYFQHILELQQREAQRRYQLEQLHRQRQEAQRRQQYQEYQRRKAYAIEKERQRIAAAKAAEDQSKHLFLALEDLIFGGLNEFYRACQQHNDEDGSEMDEVELAHKNDTYQSTSTAAAAPQTPAVDIKGKGKAQDNDEDIKPAMEVDSDETAAAAAAALMATDEDPEEVGPVPTSPTIAASPSPAPVTSTKTEQIVFTHAFPADPSFDKSTVRADQINVSVDETQRKVTVSGLWNNQPTSSTTDDASSSPGRAASPTPSDSSSRRGRSRSPKRARVSDVDENGNEIATPDADTNDDDFVEVSFTRAAPAQAKVERTFDLPAGANIEDLRAELTDDGLKLFTSVSA